MTVDSEFVTMTFELARLACRHLNTSTDIAACFCELK